MNTWPPRYGAIATFAFAAAAYETNQCLSVNDVDVYLDPDPIAGPVGRSVLVRFLRLQSSVQFFPSRTALADIDIAGTTIPKGAPIFLM